MNRVLSVIFDFNISGIKECFFLSVFFDECVMVEFIRVFVFIDIVFGLLRYKCYYYDNVINFLLRF